jgi:hypothetical protein
MPKFKRFQVVSVAFSISEIKTVTAYRVHDVRDDIFVGIDFLVQDNPFLTKGEANKVAFWLNNWDTLAA